MLFVILIHTFMKLVWKMLLSEPMICLITFLEQFYNQINMY